MIPEGFLGPAGAVAGALGALATAVTAYVSLGGPLPATRGFVVEQLAVVTAHVKRVDSRLVWVTKVLLRTEADALKAALARTTDNMERSILSRRLNTIEDEIKALEGIEG